jgi:hypothetical protein
MRFLRERNVDDGAADAAVAVLRGTAATRLGPMPRRRDTDDLTLAKSSLSPSIAAVATASPTQTSRWTSDSAAAPIALASPSKRPCSTWARDSGAASWFALNLSFGRCVDCQIHRAVCADAINTCRTRPGNQGFACELERRDGLFTRFQSAGPDA